MGADDIQGSPAGPGWYPDPYRQHLYRYWDGTVWTNGVHDVVPCSAPGPKRRSRTWVWVGVVLALFLCGACSVGSLVGLAGTGLSWQAKAMRLVTSAPVDGSSVTTTFTVGACTEVAGIKQVTLSSVNDRLDHYSVRLEPGFDYRVNGSTSTMDGFFQEARRKVGARECAMTYTRRGVQSLNLIE